MLNLFFTCHLKIKKEKHHIRESKWYPSPNSVWSKAFRVSQEDYDAFLKVPPLDPEISVILSAFWYLLFNFKEIEDDSLTTPTGVSATAKVSGGHDRDIAKRSFGNLPSFV